MRWPWVPPTSTEKIAPRIPLEILIQLVRSGATRTGLQFVERLGDITAHDGDGLDFLVWEKPTKTLK